MARQKPPSKAGAFWRAINVREDLAHDSAQGFVLECCAAAQREELCPAWGKPPYGAPVIMQTAQRQKNKTEIGVTVSLFAWRAIRKLDSITRA